MSAIPDPRSLPVVRPSREKRRAKKAPRRHEEDDLQAAIVERFTVRRAPDAICAHIPNGGFRDWNTAKGMKHAGAMAGFPDLVFLNVFGLAFFMEVKAKTGSLRKEQREFRDWCVANSIPWTLVRTLGEAEAWMERHGLISPNR